MLESDWFLTAHIYNLILLIELQNCDLSDYQELVIKQKKLDSYWEPIKIK